MVFQEKEGSIVASDTNGFLPIFLIIHFTISNVILFRVKLWLSIIVYVNHNWRYASQIFILWPFLQSFSLTLKRQAYYGFLWYASWKIHYVMFVWLIIKAKLKLFLCMCRYVQVYYWCMSGWVICLKCSVMFPVIRLLEFFFF